MPEANEIVINLSKDSKEGIYQGNINIMGESQAVVMIENGTLIDINSRKKYGEVKTIEGKAKTTGKAWKLYAIDDFRFQGLRFPVSGFPNGDYDRPGRTVLVLEFNEKGIQYQQYDPVLENNIAPEEVPF